MKRYSELRKKRLEKEKLCGKGIYNSRDHTIYIENIPVIFSLAKRYIKFSGLYDTFNENAKKVRIRHETWYFDNLPHIFDNFKILHLSDLHIDSIPELADIIPRLMKQTSHDMVVFTGDYKFAVQCSKDNILSLMKPLIDTANKAEFGAYGILGNHDYLDYSLENIAEAGLELLINESISIEKENSSIQIIGLDDPHFYKTGRLFDFRNELKSHDFNILLAHSPELYMQAAQSKIDFYLCGHTHGGQMCLPGSIPVITNSRTSRRYIAGRWKYNNLQGYTSLGTGSSGLPIRWNCPPEITVHHLKVK